MSSIDTEDAQLALARAQVLEREGRVEAAAALYERVWSLRERSPAAAVCAAQAGIALAANFATDRAELHEAEIQWYQRVSRLPNAPARLATIAAHTLAMRFDRFERFSDAITWFERAWNLDGSAEISRFALGNAFAIGRKLESLGRYGEAADVWVRLSQWPDLAVRARHPDGQVLNEATLQARAVAAYSKRVERHRPPPHDSRTVREFDESRIEAFIEEGLGLHAAGRSLDALRLFERVIGGFANVAGALVDRQVANALLAEGRVLVELGRLEAAVRSFADVQARLGNGTGNGCEEIRELALRAKRECELRMRQE